MSQSDNFNNINNHSKKIEESSNDKEWKEFIFNFFNEEKKKNPNITLKDVYSVAKKKFMTRNKSCDICLDLIANSRKHKRKTNK
tara:strand:- start:1212 stop:1463 length:252 start_codon:yes stop_codon:yes gene_type:complete